MFSSEWPAPSMEPPDDDPYGEEASLRAYIEHAEELEEDDYDHVGFPEAENEER